MKYKIIAAALAAAIMAGSAIPAYAAQENALEGYPVTVHDASTPAIFAGGKDWPITTWYFYDANGKVLGGISGQTATAIMQAYPSGNIQWEYWLADAFNDYRETGIRIPAKPTQIRPSVSTEGFDAEKLALEVIELTNAEREAHRLEPLPIDDGLMELAQIRAEEVSRKYSHERPDGTTVVDLGCGENVGARKTPAIQVEKWMASEGHRNNILLDRYKSIGVGCYQTKSGKIYWVQVFGT